MQSSVIVVQSNKLLSKLIQMLLHVSYQMVAKCQYVNIYN